METSMLSPAVYRDYDIVFNPSGKAGETCSDRFMILAPSANPMYSSVLYEQPGDQVQVYASAQEAYDAAMSQARAWIDARLDGTPHPLP